MSQTFAEYEGATWPIEADVRNGIQYTDGVTIFTGTLIPTSFGHPSPDDVRLGIIFGDQLQYVGNCRVPPEDKVELGYMYDTNDSLTGTMPSQVGVVPDPGDVRQGVSYGPAPGMIGVLVLPAEAQVLVGVGYGADGTEFVGSLQQSGYVLQDGTLIIVRGDDILLTFSDPGTWPNLSGATIKLGFLGPTGLQEFNGSVGTGNSVNVALSNTDTAGLAYSQQYDLQADVAGSVTTLEHGQAVLLDTYTDRPTDPPLTPQPLP